MRLLPRVASDLHLCRPAPLQLPAIAMRHNVTQYFFRGGALEATSVTSKGQVTIPKELRQRLRPVQESACGGTCRPGPCVDDQAMIGLDVNVLARYYVEDAGDAEARKQRVAARRLMESGQPLMIGKMVLLELEWVLRGFARPARKLGMTPAVTILS